MSGKSALYIPPEGMLVLWGFIQRIKGLWSSFVRRAGQVA